MQLKDATSLELRLSECLYRCETELSASELETTIVSCLADACNELQRLREIIKSINLELNRGIESYPKTTEVPWAASLYIGHKPGNLFWVRWTGLDGIYRWLHPIEKRWVDEPEQMNMPNFSNYASARIAANQSPKPPTW